jgi:hypothetical protein
MPIIAIYALIAASLIGGGYGACWSHMTGEIALRDARLKTIGDTSAKLLADKTAEAEKIKTEQLETIKTLAVQNEKIDKYLADPRLAADYDSNARLWASHQSSCGNAVSKAGAIGRDTPNVEKRAGNIIDGESAGWLDTWQVASGFRSIVQAADRRDAECHKALIEIKHNIETVAE